MAFALHPQLQKDTHVIGDLKLCRVLLMNNANFPWLILVPMREGVRELFDLNAQDYQTAMEEMRATAATFAALTGAHKMNVAALGNMVEQLHIHVIARFKDDPAWPNPVWNSAMASLPYESATLAEMLEKTRAALNITKM